MSTALSGSEPCALNPLSGGPASPTGPVGPPQSGDTASDRTRPAAGACAPAGRRPVGRRDTMLRSTGCIPAAFVLLLLANPEAEAQFNYVGPGSTVHGDFGRGAGAAAFGWGTYHYHNALARS